MDKVGMGIDIRELDAISAKLRNLQQQQADADEKLFNDKMDRLEAEYNKRVQIQKELTQMGLKDNVAQANARMKAIDDEKKKMLKAAESRYSGKELKAKQKEIEAEYRLKEKEELKLMDKKSKWAYKYMKSQEAAIAIERSKKEGSELMSGLGAGHTFKERQAALSKAFHNEDGELDMKKGMSALVNGISDLAKQMEKTVDEIAGKKGGIDTRLQGSKNKRRGGSYWDQMAFDVMGVAGVSPFIRQSDVVGNIQEYVKKGISYNVEQRAFLATISSKIATTFDAADGTLLRLVRIQQQDSTAGRLGMESMINSFLNNMYETTEYLSDLAGSVRSSLDEVEALMGAADAVALEYQVQKWMGSLYSVGMSRNAVSGIAQAFGQLAAGDISGLTGGGMGNLMIMAANQAGLSIADILAEGLDDSNTNKLMAAMVEYLQQIAGDSSDSRVVQQQLAKVYGLTASDLRAATNMKTSMGATYNSSLNYAGAIQQLNKMANTMYQRTSIGEMMTNVWDNFQYTMANGMATNPVTYLIYKAASLLDSVAGGIRLPDIGYLGTKINLNTTVADLMRVASMSGGIMSGIGSMIGNLSAGGGFSGAGMLKALGISGTMNAVKRGGGGVAYTPISGTTTSESGSLVGQGDTNSIQEQTIQNANDSQKSKLVEAQESEENDLTRKEVNDSILKIYELLQNVVNGSESIAIRQAWGSTWSGPGTGAQ